MALNSTCHIVHACPTALIMYSTYKPHINAHINLKKKKKKKWQFYLQYDNHICTTNKYAPKCHIYKLAEVQIGHKYVNRYKSYKLNAIESMIRSTGTHTFYITGICPSINISHFAHVTLHVYCSSHRYYITAHSHQKSINYNLYLPNYYKICVMNKYATQMPQICNMPKLLHNHLWLKQSTFDNASITDAARINVNRWHRRAGWWWWWCRITVMEMPWPNYMHWVEFRRVFYQTNVWSDLQRYYLSKIHTYAS